MSKREELSSSVIGTGIPFGNSINENSLKEIKSISKASAGIRRMGSAAIDLAYVASGKFDGFWEKDMEIWDIGVGALLVNEAGGKVTEPSGQKWSINSKDILASNALIHPILEEKLTLL